MKTREKIAVILIVNAILALGCIGIWFVEDYVISEKLAISIFTIGSIICFIGAHNLGGSK